MQPPLTSFYATCPAGLAPVLARELELLGVHEARAAGAGVRFGRSLEDAYRALLWSRVANRILLPLAIGAAGSADALYRTARSIDWSRHLVVSGTLAVDAFVSHSSITHSQFAAQKVKDAVVDQFRDIGGERPGVDRQSPDVRINAYLHRDQVRLAIDIAGMSMHRRGYRVEAGAAPLKENLAAALLLAVDWPERAIRGSPFIDPLCGSGTLVIEAALMAGCRAPGLLRKNTGIRNWLEHDAPLWERLVDEAQRAARPIEVPVHGFDQDAQAVALASAAAGRAGVADGTDFAVRTLADGPPAVLSRSSHPPGLVLCNPPYGQRLATDEGFYSELGRSLSAYAGWYCALFLAAKAPLRHTGLALAERLAVNNGPIPCRLSVGQLPAMTGRGSRTNTDAASCGDGHVDASGLANRLRKNDRALLRWRRAEGIAAYRVYDADLPEFAFAIDVYHCAECHLVVQEYQAPASVNQMMAERRRNAALRVLEAHFDIPPKRIHLRRRERMSGRRQYQRQTQHTPGSDSLTGHTMEVLEERALRFGINFVDYLDTGLFLDHRPLRRYVQSVSAGKRLLNLFAYTASISVAAAAGGARSSLSVDLSRRYCQWARFNFELNGMDPVTHAVVRADVRKWLADAAGNVHFDLILLDPPTFSNSSATTTDWQVQRDHSATIRSAMRLLAKDGLLVFSTHLRNFCIDQALSADAGGPFRLDERTGWSIDRDFQRNRRIHQCWFIRHAEGG